MAILCSLISPQNLADAKAAGEEKNAPPEVKGGVFTDPAQTATFIKGHPDVKALIVSSDFDLATQEKAKAEAEAAVPGIKVLLVPQDKKGPAAKEWIMEQRENYFAAGESECPAAGSMHMENEKVK